MTPLSLGDAFEARRGVEMSKARRRARHQTRWWQKHPLIIHAAMLTTLLLVLIPLTRASSPVWADDDALYGLQVLALRDGSWERAYSGASFDPKGEYRPAARGEMVD